jgi:hypothetical protein
MKKQRWRWTKNVRFCDECYRRLDTRDKYAMQWNACDVTCKLHSVGMSWSDFY